MAAELGVSLALLTASLAALVAVDEAELACDAALDDSLAALLAISASELALSAASDAFD